MKNEKLDNVRAIDDVSYCAELDATRIEGCYLDRLIEVLMRSEARQTAEKLAKQSEK